MRKLLARRDINKFRLSVMRVAAIFESSKSAKLENERGIPFHIAMQRFLCQLYIGHRSEMVRQRLCGRFKMVFSCLTMLALNEMK